MLKTLISLKAIRLLLILGLAIISVVNIAHGDTNLDLITASDAGSVSNVQKALDGGAEVDAKNTNGTTSLWVASQKGYKEIVKLLLEKGADVEAKDDKATTPLLIASLNDKLDVVKLLLEKGADVNAKRSDGISSLFIASQEGYMEIVKLLLSNGAKVDEKGFKGITPLWVASQQGHAEIVKILLNKDADVDAKGTYGLTPLMMASQTGNTEVVKLLLDKGANVNSRVTIDGVQHTCISLAERMDQKKVVEILKNVGIESGFTFYEKAEKVLPEFTGGLTGNNPVRVRNPNDFIVTAGVRSGNKGNNLVVPANGVETIFVPDGNYEIYFVYSSRPESLFQGDSFALQGNGVEIQIVKVINGNYSIRQVK
jgi:ankyrin repeat protein